MKRSIKKNEMGEMGSPLLVALIGPIIWLAIAGGTVFASHKLLVAMGITIPNLEKFGKRCRNAAPYFGGAIAAGLYSKFTQPGKMQRISQILTAGLTGFAMYKVIAPDKDLEQVVKEKLKKQLAVVIQSEQIWNKAFSGESVSIRPEDKEYANSVDIISFDMTPLNPLLYGSKGLTFKIGVRNNTNKMITSDLLLRVVDYDEVNKKIISQKAGDRVPVSLNANQVKTINVFIDARTTMIKIIPDPKGAILAMAALLAPSSSDLPYKFSEPFVVV